MDESIYRLPNVMKKTGLSRSRIYERIKEGTFPKQINLGPRTVGWLGSEIDAWLKQCIASRYSVQ